MVHWAAIAIRLLLVIVSLAGCAAAPGANALTSGSDATRRLFYVGLALYSEPWSENDVVELGDELQRTSAFIVVPLIASNGAAGGRTFPTVTDATIIRLIGTARELAGPADVVLMHLSSHGTRGALARQFGSHQPTALTGQQLVKLLAPLGDRRTVIIISACYSGSLIPQLAAPHRIIITAARADRSSFGCSANSRHTFFGDAELAGFSEGHRSLRQIFATISATVTRMERDENFRPSEPQISVGSSMIDFYDAPLF